MSEREASEKGQFFAAIRKEAELRGARRLASALGYDIGQAYTYEQLVEHVQEQQVPHETRADVSILQSRRRRARLEQEKRNAVKICGYKRSAYGWWCRGNVPLTCTDGRIELLDFAERARKLLEVGDMPTHEWYVKRAALLAECEDEPTASSLRQRIDTKIALRRRPHWNCPECGPHVAVDEDGCCSSCGADAVPINAAGECDLCGAGIESGDGHNEGCEHFKYPETWPRRGDVLP